MQQQVFNEMVWKNAFDTRSAMQLSGHSIASDSQSNFLTRPCTKGVQVLNAELSNRGVSFGLRRHFHSVIQWDDRTAGCRQKDCGRFWCYQNSRRNKKIAVKFPAKRCAQCSDTIERERSWLEVPANLLWKRNVILTTINWRFWHSSKAAALSFHALFMLRSAECQLSEVQKQARDEDARAHWQGREISRISVYRWNVATSPL